ncbi:bZIP transcription factor [Natrinema salifodinae]|uniref:DUF7982 domain-containing protein n=1 Tax=Natrinema salifodinae TaxID=1202768 RepID=A0A1I0LYQ1_9EURY|nr:bZIP transcription factor [Natrinema salifodinae]SEV81071.1 hypothetical protein SAMN05216285_0184 [Natrinema salifodinae]
MSANNFGGDDLSSDDGVAVRVDGDANRSELEARIEQLAEENRRLREENERLRAGERFPYRPQYRRLGFGLVLLGAIFAVGAVLVPAARDVLFATAATGLFGGLLTYTLSPGTFLAATICDRIYAATAANGGAFTDELDLGGDRVYVPDGDGGASLFVPRGSDGEIPASLDGPAVTDDNRGVILESTGMGLFREFERTTSGHSDAPSALAARLADTLVEQFELARSVEASVGESEGMYRVAVTVSHSVLGDVDRFDHPIASFFAVGLAARLDRPIVLEATEKQGQAEWRLRYRSCPSDGNA